MIPIYVIALANSERFHKLSKDLQEQGLNFIKISAVDGTRLSKDELKASFDKGGSFARLGYEMSLQLIGCGLSHKIAYGKGIQEEQVWILILEEDVRLCANFKYNLENLVRQLDVSTPTVCQLFTRGDRFIRKKSLTELYGGRYLFRFMAPPGQTAGYLINKAALLIATREEKLSGPPDWPNWSHNVKFIGTFPFLITETAEGTSIGSPPLSRKMYWRRNLSKLFAWHFVQNIKFYPNMRSYYLLEMKPIILRVAWRLRGKPTFPMGDERGVWVI
jgi:GR25 family glycosyltransferase involved in LPS biosynthesis